MPRIEGNNQPQSSSQNRSLVVRSGNRLVRAVQVTFSPITFIFRGIYRLLFGSRRRGQESERVSSLEQQRMRGNTNILNEQKAQQRAIVKEQCESELAKLDEGKEAVLTPEMLEFNLGLNIIISSDELQHLKKVTTTFNREIETITLKTAESGATIITEETRRNDWHQTTKRIIHTDSHNNLNITFDIDNIYRAKRCVVEHDDQTSTYTFRTDRETNNVIIKKETITS